MSALVEDRFDPAFDFTDVVEIAVDSGPIGGREPLLQAGSFFHNGVEDAAIFAFARQTLLGRSTVTKQFFEYHLRAVLHRQRNRGSTPRDRIEVGAAVTRATAQADVLDCKLDRRQRRVLSDVFRSNLVHGHADPNGIFLRLPATEKNGSGARMFGSGVRPGRSLMGQIADDAEAIAIFFERAERFGELKILAFARRRPLVHGGAMRNVEAAETGLRNRRRVPERRLGRYHRFEQRQGDGHTCAAQKRSP